MKRHQEAKIKIDLSLRREVFFVVLGAILGAILMVDPLMIFESCILFLWIRQLIYADQVKLEKYYPVDDLGY